MSDPVISADRFSAAFANILEGYGASVQGKVMPAARKAAQTARRKWRDNALGEFKGTGRYAAGVTYKVKATDDGAYAEIGNKDLPGLAHLLEKGHAKVGGGRVEGREHIAPASDDAADVFEHELRKGIRGI